jgi:hypothetical protein
MAEQERDKSLQGSQQQSSTQSAGQRGGEDAKGRAAPDKARPGIGSSQGQDSGSADRDAGERPSAGTPDIERGAATPAAEPARGSEESLVNESTGAFKERP